MPAIKLLRGVEVAKRGAVIESSREAILNIFCKRLRVRLRRSHVGIYLRIERFRFFCTPQISKQNRTVLERSTRGTLSVLHQSTVGAKKPDSFANLKEIVHLQDVVLN